MFIRTFLPTIVILFAAAACFPQTKSLENGKNQINAFTNAGAFSLEYDSASYLTVARITFSALAEKDDLKKTFSKFDWQMSTFFAISGIDSKPVRNTICIASQSKQFQFSRDNTLSVTFTSWTSVAFTSGTVNFGEPIRASELKRGKANENLCWDVNSEVVNDFAESRSISFKVGNIASDIPDVKLSIFKEYAALVSVSNEK